MLLHDTHERTHEELCFTSNAVPTLRAGNGMYRRSASTQRHEVLSASMRVVQLWHMQDICTMPQHIR